MRDSILAILLSSVAALLPIAAAAQTPASIAVRVVTKESGAPLPGAQITIRGDLRATADEEGWARVASVPPGMHVVQVRHIGYAPEEFLLQFPTGAALREVVALQPAPVELAPVAVRAAPTNRALESRGFYARRAMGTGTFLDRDGIEQVGHGRSTVSTVLRTMQGVRLLVPLGGRGWILTSRRSGQSGVAGSGTCAAQIIVDGVRVQGVGSTLVNIDDVVDLHQVEAIEWYRGSSQTPAQFNETGRRDRSGSVSAACGTLVIWTRLG